MQLSRTLNWKPLLIRLFTIVGALFTSVMVILVVTACDDELSTASTPTLTFSTDTFTEASSNDGAIGNQMTITVDGGNFRDEVDLYLDQDEDYTVSCDNNGVIPPGLTPTALLNPTNGEMIFSLKGNASEHAAANSVTCTLTVLEAAFSSAVDYFPGPNFKKFTIAFNDPQATLAYSSSTFSEGGSNNGSIGNEITIDLTGGSFVQASGTFTQDTHYTVTGNSIPTGLTPVVTVNSANQIVFSMSGNASTHTSSQNVSGVTITFLAAAFSNDLVPTDGSASHDVSVGFSDPAVPTLAYSATSLTESASNTGGISATIDATVTSDVWALSSGTFTLNTHYTLTGTAVPSGLTPVLTRIDATTARLSFTGSAGSHAAANNVSGITLSFLAAAFTNGNAPTNGTQTQNVSIVFKDPYNLSYSATSFLENSSNAGGISETVDVTLANDTWSIGSGTFTLNTHYTLTGTAVPAGLTAVLTRISATVARLSFTGAATSHASANDVSGITLTFLGAAFTGTTAPSNGSQTQNFSIDFSDSNILLYSAGTYNGNLGGRTGADALCDAQRPTGYRTHSRAFISVSGADELRDMDVLYTIPSDQAVVSSSGTPMATDWADLIDGSIGANLLAAGILLMPNNWWSGSDNTGALSTNHCLGWTSDSTVTTNDGATGSSMVDTNWIFAADFDCGNDLVLLCVAFQ